MIVSKSGNTIETIINLSCFKPFLKKSNVIIISENKNNILSAFAKSQIACGTILPSNGKVFISVDDENKKFILNIVKKLINLNFKIVATKGTAKFLNEKKLDVEIINKVKNGYSIALMVDQRVGESDRVPFFGIPAHTTTIPAQIAIKFNLEIVPIYLKRFYIL